MTESAYLTDQHAMTQSVEVPGRLLTDSRVTSSGLRLYATLRYLGAEPLTYREIADVIGCSPRSIASWARQLTDTGWVHRHEVRDPFGGLLAYRYETRDDER